MPSVNRSILIGGGILAVTLGALLLAGVRRAPDAGPADQDLRIIVSAKAPGEQTAALERLLERIGPEAAQEELKRSGLPFTGQSHLLVHAVGDFLYEREGPAGLSKCRDYFLAACYHGVILRTLAEHGMGGVANAMTACRQASQPVMLQCSHAGGHGFLASTDYDLLKALSLCNELGAQTAGFVYNSCYEGVFMENLWGVHGGKPSQKRWLKPDEPAYPCTDPRIAERYQTGCWANQASVMYQMFGGDLKKTAEGCDSVTNETYRRTCYNNFARQIHPLTEGRADRAFELCQNASGEEWQNYCLITIAESAFAVGDRERIPFEICARIAPEAKPNCHQKLIGLIAAHAAAGAERQTFCRRLREATWQEQCLNQTAP